MWDYRQVVKREVDQALKQYKGNTEIVRRVKEILQVEYKKRDISKLIQDQI